MGNVTDEMAENGLSMIENVDPTFANDRVAFPEQVENDYDEIEEQAQDSDSFMELYEESLKSIQEGKVIKGEIVQIDNEFVLVDIGYKSEGQIHINEFMNSDGQLTAKVGQKVDVLLVRKEDKEGRIILSKEKAAAVKIWDDVEETYKNHGTIKGKVLSRVRGGLSVDIGLQAFLPGSQADLRPIRDLDTLIGTENDFMIVKYERRQGNIVLSRRALLEAERKALREKTIEILEKDAILKGIVRGIADFGLFIDLGGIDGLVHINDISWRRVRHPSDMFNVGDELTVKVLSFDREKERVSLGIKQLTPDPWQEAQEKYTAGAKIKGRVVGLKEYGAFVEVEEGMEGLVHVSEMSWTGKISHPSQILSVGDDLEVMVLDIDSAKKRISLSIKQLEPNPWDSIAENYPVGTTIEGKVKNITDFGIFIGIDEGIDGLVHVSDMSWAKSIKQPSELYTKGQEVQAVVLNIDKEVERFSLGIKQLTPDPWDAIPEIYKPGTLFKGRITNITDFGLFVELESGIEGLVHISELPNEKEGGPLSHFQIGDVIQAKVASISQKDKKIRLSMQELNGSTEEDIYSYVSNHKGATSNLGELLKEEMTNQKERALQ
jgi:small subunit ribosomal protein S1